jgi:TonB family protein
MSTPLTQLIRHPLEFTAGKEAASWTAGFAVTFALFFAIAHLENIGGTAAKSPEILDLPMISIPPETPPPSQRTVEPPRAEETLPMLTGLELENTGNPANDSPVKVVVLPPDLEALMAKQHGQMPALASIGRFSTNTKPQVGVEKVDALHVYQASEVDQRPTAVVRTVPRLWPVVYLWGPSLTVVLLLRIDTDGRVENARVLQSCGHPDFDEVVADCMRDHWLFSPALKRGRKVRCLVQQKFTIVFEKGSVFNVH